MAVRRYTAGPAARSTVSASRGPGDSAWDSRVEFHKDQTAGNPAPGRSQNLQATVVGTRGSSQRPPRPHSTTPARDCNRLWSLAPNKKATFLRWPFRFSSPSGCGVGALDCVHSPRTIRIRMLKMASRLGRRELGDRSVPLGYVAGRRATENNAGCHFQHSCYVPISQDARYFFCSFVSVSIFTPMPASFSRAISLSITAGTGYTFFSSIL